MILEEATKEAYGYYSKELMPRSMKLIIVSCELCGKTRVIPKDGYHYLCLSCTQKGKNNPNWKPKTQCVCLQCGKDFEASSSAINRGGGKYCCRECDFKSRKGKYSGKKSSMFGRHHSERTKVLMSAAHKGRICTEETKALISVGLKGNKNCLGNICAEETKAKIGAGNRGEKASNWRGGMKMARARSRSKRRYLGYTYIYPVKEGECGHHFTNEYVGGIPEEVHQRFSGYGRKKHRTLVLLWLKANDMMKYNLVHGILRT